MQGQDEVGQGVFGGAEEDRAFEGLVEDRGVGDGVAVDRAGRAVGAVAGAGGELDPGADGADVGLVEELGVRQGVQALSFVSSRRALVMGPDAWDAGEEGSMIFSTPSG